MDVFALITLLLYIKVSFGVIPTNYQGQLWCGGATSGQTSISSGYEHYYSFTLDRTVGNFRFSTCGSHISTYLGVYDLNGTLKYFTSDARCGDTVGGAVGVGTTSYSPGIYYVKVGEPSAYNRDGGVYVLSLNCSKGKAPDFYYNSTLIRNDDIKSISCNDEMKLDPIESCITFYEFSITSIVDINQLSFNSVEFHVNTNDSYWKHSIYYLNRTNHWTEITETSIMKKGLFRLVSKQTCDPIQYNHSNTSITIKMHCTFDAISSNIVWYQKAAYFQSIYDIGCGLTVKGYAFDGQVYPYEFVTSSELQYVSFHTCDQDDAEKNNLYFYKYIKLNYGPYIQDKFGYWDFVTYFDDENGCTHLNLTNLSNDTHYVIAMAIPYWLQGDYTIYMECSDNSAVEQPTNYTEYINFASPSKDSKYVEPSTDHVLLCDQAHNGYLHSFDSDNFFYAFKVNYYQYTIQFDTCYNGAYTTFDNVLYLYYFDKNNEWIKVNQSHSGCNKLIYYGVSPGYYYILINGYSSFEYGNFTVFMKCLDNDAVVFPDSNDDSIWNSTSIGLVLGICTTMLFCIIIFALWLYRLRAKKRKLMQARIEYNNRNVIELQQSTQNPFHFETPTKPTKRPKENRTNNFNTKTNANNEDDLKKHSDDDESDDEMIKQQPTLSYSAMNCVICLDILLENESSRLKCGHKFHTHCIEEYNETNSQCPLCRKKIVFH